MSSVSESIGRIISSARSLRQIADELGNVELKSQIIDEISTLQEIRDELAEKDGSHDVAAATASVEPAASAEPDEGSGQLKLNDAKFAYIAPSDDGETYDIGALGPGDEEAAGDSESDEDSSFDEGSSADVESEADSEVGEAEPEEKPKKSRPKLTPEQRAMAEMRIADLEPLSLDAQRRLDAVLTPEQKQIKVQATKAGREAGKSGRELQLYVHKAMKTTPEQRHQLSAARKDLGRLREAIDKELAVLDEAED